MADEWSPKRRHAKTHGLGLRNASGSSSLVELIDREATPRSHPSPAPAFVSAQPSPEERSFLSVDSDFPTPVTKQREPWSSSASTLKLSVEGLYQHCRSKQSFRRPHFGRETTLLVLLATYSTIFSGLWLAVALAKPHYGNVVMLDGPISPTLASILAAAIAKTIELSFVAVFIGFIGQYLSKKALQDEGGGMSIADMQLRTLVLQPGALITNFRCFAYVWKSVFAIMSLIACGSAMLYTTASDALGTREWCILIYTINSRFLCLETDTAQCPPNQSSTTQYSKSCIA